MHPADEFDQLENLLRPPAPGGADERLREQALRPTLRVLARRRILRRVGWTAAFAGCYLAGLATMGAWHWNAASSLVLTDPGASAPPQQPPAAGPRLVAQPQRQKTPFERLRDAGDEAWHRQGDIEAAIRLYAQAVEVATPEELKNSSVDDNWLLMAMKQDHLQENEHVDENEPSDADHS